MGNRRPFGEAIVVDSIPYVPVNTNWWFDIFHSVVYESGDVCVVFPYLSFLLPMQSTSSNRLMLDNQSEPPYANNVLIVALVYRNDRKLICRVS